MPFKHGEAITDSNPMPIVSIFDDGTPFRVGEPPSFRNPLPVKDMNSTLAGGRPHKLGEAQSDDNPWPTSDYVTGYTSTGNTLTAEDAADVFPKAQRGEPHDDDNPLPVKIVRSYFIGLIPGDRFRIGEAIKDDNPLPIKIYT